MCIRDRDHVFHDDLFLRNLLLNFVNPFVKILRRSAQNLLRGSKLHPAVFQRRFARGKAFTVCGVQRAAFHAGAQVLDACANLLQGLLTLHILLRGSGLKPVSYTHLA